MGIGASKIKTIQMLDMVEMAFGSKDVMSTHYVVGVTINPLSPLTYGTEVLETLVEFAKRKQPILILPCILAGVTGPINLIGTSVLQNAEILAGMVLVQMINPGNPVVYSPASTVGNMRTGGYITGPPEQFLINITNLQLARDMYHLPTRVMCGMTDSKEVDCQAGFETMQNLMMGILSGANIIHESLGVLDSIMTISYEKFIIDEELIQRVFRIADGVNASEQALSVDVIQEVGTGGTYLTHDSTYERFGNLWKPSVSNWDDYDTWKENGSESILVRANKKFKEVLQNCPESMMDGCLEKELKTYVHTILEKN
jgi:trimethylamine--corrinoid protein Co-methyltransferase